ncbi:hypothetical protein, partial [Stenotrophomonas maltophilia]|uniref:hypothetical protein n=1 Tax=Stenotrophomonas maltophilia TaxID=40324 RepID=UPI001C60F943
MHPPKSSMRKASAPVPGTPPGCHRRSLRSFPEAQALLQTDDKASLAQVLADLGSAGRWPAILHAE